MISVEQQAEIDKYTRIYSKYDNYHMKGPRFEQAKHDLKLTEHRTSYLDIGCGRGEMLYYAQDLGFSVVMGTETVPSLCKQHGVSFAVVTDIWFSNDAFQVVSCLDVLEHILPEDTEKALQELARVASKSLLLTANNLPSKSLGVELHINKRPYEEWDELIRKHCGGSVRWLESQYETPSETWLISYD